MNREIKFRAWDKQKKKFTYPKLWDNTMPSNWEFHYELNQYTGLNDKNGKEIYEGDILYNDFNAKGVVKFVNGMFIVHFIYEESVCTKDNDEMITRLISVNSITRIIGNIYENLELLK